ncbi:MAG TPA: tRNA pseudouridine(38-40) synthase TruA [bacterium]|nr:tRNA pseudouridine(38-40) synthase TruA [bacterium]HNT64554.1 tRNA pseudouridine(38-40) synthase TruA [bacterium]HOX84603.1 tRNA pseudouridine(38-40) synthase TruA [bacterium]HPG45326.1 tRNA pseudouridine(38-40) synthase TruA [bacterium]HPM98955.1 tRNA pseudouridine(38-40) synthase TruA [bacterium]
MSPRNIKLTLEYDGSDFCGWQIQPNLRTVQGEVEKAICGLTGQMVRVITAGRTDTGVHARGQVINFLSDSRLSCAVFVRGLNALLPPDVRVLAAEQAPDDFNSRFSARQRTYRYSLCTRPFAIGRKYAWTVPCVLDLLAMQEASKWLLGEQDFRAFCHAGADVNHYRCRVTAADWLTAGDQLYFVIRANRFLHNMVRIIVGTCVEIGRGRWRPDDMALIIASGDRCQAGPTAPAHGLTLESIDYDSSSSIPNKP